MEKEAVAVDLGNRVENCLVKSFEDFFVHQIQNIYYITSFYYHFYSFYERIIFIVILNVLLYPIILILPAALQFKCKIIVYVIFVNEFI